MKRLEQGASVNLQPYGLRTLDTGLEKLNELLIGGLPLDTVTQIYGAKGTGKTLLVMALAYRFIREEGKSVMYCDLELGFRKGVGAYWYQPFNQRFGIVPPLFEVGVERYAKKRQRKIREKEVKIALESSLRDIGIKFTDEQLRSATNIFLPEYELTLKESSDTLAPNTKTPGIFTLEEGSLQRILGIHGVKVQILSSEGGRVEVRMQPGTIRDIASTPIGEFVRKNDVGMIIYDSLSAPLKETFTGTQDFPARAASIQVWLGRIEELCNNCGITALIVNQETFDPMRHSKKPYASSTLGYRTKFILHLEGMKTITKAPSGCLNPGLVGEANRIIWTERHPKRADHADCALFKLNKTGFHC